MKGMILADGSAECDRVPELTHYEDQGCRYYASCLGCPFAACLYDDPHGARHARNQRRDAAIRTLYAGGETIPTLAQRFGLTERGIYRATVSIRPPTRRRGTKMKVAPVKTYRGYSEAERGDGTGPALVVVVDDAGARPLKHEMRHSPSGFSWGFAGSGPGDLARSILSDHLGFVPPSRVYQRFKTAFVARWPLGGAWTITSAEIDGWLNTTGLRDALVENGGDNAI